MNDNKDKIKKLYDTFVSDGYEMESEEQFRKNLQNASKRKAAYDALVKDGYEMEAYDQFEKNLGFGAASTPAPKTEKPAELKSAAPKRKGTPLTKADKARMMSEINALMRRTQQITADFNDHMSNMMEYGINLGQQTKKSKFEQTYITPAGNRYTSKAIADAESFQYRQAADMSVSGQLRRAHQKLADLKEKQQQRANEVLDEWKEYTKKNKAPLGMVLAAQTYIPRQQSDKENSALRVAIRETEELIKDLEEQKDRENGVDVGFWRGFGRTMGDMRTWDFGMGDLQDAMTMLNADKLTAKDATEGEKAAYNEMMGAMATHQQAQQQYGGNAGFWNRAGVMTGYMPSFMLDFALTGGGFDGLNVLGKGGAKLATKAVGKEAVKEMAEQGFKTYVKNNGMKGLMNEATNWTIKALGTTADDLLVRAPLMTNTVQAGKTAADIIDRKLGDVVVDENGNYDFSHDKTWGSAIWQGEANSIIENYSEMFGAHLYPVVTLGNMSKLANVVGAKRLGGVLAKADAQALGGIMGQTQQMFNKMGVSDYVGEVAEEYYGQLWRTMLNLDDAYMQNPDGTRTNLLATKDFHGDIWGGMALSMGMMGAGKHTFNAVQYASMRHGMNKSDARVGELLGKDIWEPLKATLDLTTNENFGGVAEAIVNDKDFTDKEKAAVLDYMERSMIMRGYNLASMAQSRGGEQNESKQQQNESYLNGYEITSGRERNDAKNMLEYQRQRIEQLLSEEDLQMIDSWEDGTVQADSPVWTDEQRDAVNDYLNAKSVYDGMKQRLQDDVDAEVENSNAMVDARVNTDTGMIQGATMKQDDRKVYVVSGNVVAYPDGTGIDLEASDQSIIVRDADTGELEQVAPDAVFSIDEVIDPNQAKSEAEGVIVENAAQKFANDIDGTITLEAGNTFDVVDEDGRQASVTITPNAEGIVDNGDGTVNVSMDGTNVVPVPVSALQEMADAANMDRVAQFEEQRTLENAQVKAAEQEAARPLYALNDEVTLRDENGNAVRGSIIADADADGMYEVYTEDPINGARVNLFSRDELDGIVVEHNGEVVEQPTIVPESAEVVKGAEIGNNGTENIPENGNIVEKNIPTVPQPTALERIPKDEQGQPIYEQTDSDTAWDAIVEQTEGDEGIAQSVADAMLADKEAELKKMEKAKPKGGVTIADKIAAEKERKAAISAAQDVVSVWKKIAGTSQRRKQEAESIRRKEMEEKAAIRRAEEEKLRAEREEAERIEREALNGVPDMVDDKPQDARARGYRRVTGTKVDRQQPLEAKRGKNVQVRFSDSDIADGSVAVLDASQLQPSHIEGVRNPLHFIDEAQPKERNDDASKMSSRKIAANMRPEEITSSVTAYTGAPTVNSRGEVIQGNNRSDALRQMWQSEPEQAAKYKQYLTDHAEEFGLNPADIEAMERPVLVNMLDVDDNKAIELGQFVAQDTESGGTERIKPKNAVQKIGSNMGSFANLLLRSADDETSFSGLVDANGHDVLKWMNAKGYITPTQYQSAFDTKGNLTAEAKNDLKGIMYQSIFKGGSTRLEEMFNALPAKAQKAILATAYRDYGSPNAERMVEEIQNSIRAFYALMQDAAFVEAKNYKDVRLAIEGWKRQYQMDDVTGESYLPADNFSNFALNLAALYKGESQSLIQATFNKMFDLIQGTQEETLFEKPDNTPRTLAQAIKETLNIDYNGQQRSNVLADNSAASQDGQGSSRASETGERSEDGNGTADRTGGAESESREDDLQAGSNYGVQEVHVGLNDNEAEEFLSRMEANAVPMPQLELTPQAWGEQFGDDGKVTTPVGSVKMGVNQIAKLFEKGRSEQFGMIRPTLTEPLAIIEVPSEATDGNTERATSLLFVKTFVGKNGEKVYYFKSVTVKKDGMEVSVSSHYDRPKRIKEALKTGKLLYRFDGGAQTEQRPADVSVTASQEDVQGISTDKGNINSGNNGKLGEKIAEAEAKTNQNPTEKQKEAGNYKKGHVQIGAFDVTIENPKGSVRSGVDAKGNKWEIEMHNTYGYIRGTEGVDGDHIDVFLADDIDSWNGRKVFVVDQYNEDGTFDEHKVMLGFNDAEEARAAYLSNYEKGWQNTHKAVGTPVNLEDFEKWINSSHRKTKAFAEYSDVKKQQETERKQNLSQFNVGDVVRDYYTGKLYRVKKFTKTGLCTIAELDSNDKEIRTTSFNADNNPRFGAAEAPATTTTEEKSKEEAPDTNVGSIASTDGYSVEPAQYTTKRGKVLDMQLVKFDRELSKEETRNAKALAKELKGWYDKEKGGFMMRSTEDAQKLADAVMDESGEALEDAAPLSMSDVQEASGVEDAEQTKEAAPTEQEAPAENMHKLVTNERYEQLKKRMMAKLNQLNMGIDPEMLAIGTEMAVYHIEGGARKFAQYAKAMIADMGDAIRPYLKSFYNAVRDLPEAQELANSMDSYDDVSKFDVANFDKASTNAMATAEMVVAESEAEEQATEAKEAITNQRNTTRRQKNEQTTADTEAITSKATTIARDAERRIEEATTEKQVEEAQKKVDKQLQEIDKQLAELDYVNSLHSGMRVVLKDGKKVTATMVMHQGEQISATQMSKPRVGRVYAVGRDGMIDFTPDKIDIPATIAANEEAEQRRREFEAMVERNESPYTVTPEVEEELKKQSSSEVVNGFKRGDKVVYTPSQRTGERRYRSILGEAADVAMQHELKVGNYQEQNSNSQHTAVADDALFRDGDPEVHERVLARDRYEERVKRGMFQTQEALQDSMLGLREAMNAILRADGIKENIEDVKGFENAYLGENRLSSVNKAEADAFAHLVFKPMLDEVAKLAKTEAEREELTDYMMAKHGLERNIVMAERDFIKYQQDNPNGTKTLDDFRERDYAGLTALTGMDDVADAEAEAQAMVSGYELNHDTADLWEKVNAVNAATLSKTYECGMMSKETYESVKSMYEYYIPLRGFDEKTSNEAYAYLTDKHSAFNAPIKKAHGRSSKADDPFANMQSMAESAIMQGNRNKLVKQRFLNFVLNHPSDLASVSDLWIQYDEVMDEWKPVFPDNIETTDTPDEVEKKMIAFNEKMEQLRQSEPDKYKRGKDAVGIPYRVVESGDLRQHQIVVKRNGRDYIITINGNPRAAQALNGQTNPDNDMSGAIGAVLRGGEKINRQLSAFYTTRNPDFVISNFMRDMLYTNTMVWIKESPNYALRFNRNVLSVNPAKMKSLLAKHRKGELDMNDPIEQMFHQFMMNGGETGYANIRDIEQHKNDIRRELKKANSKIPIKRAWDLLGERFDEFNRTVENSARFAAFITSRQFGRSIDRAIYDAKEISVNFNKKGSGAKFYDAVGQTKLSDVRKYVWRTLKGKNTDDLNPGLGNTAALLSGLGRSGFVFWNAAIQGTTNFGRQAKRHPVKALTAVATMFLLGALMAYMNGDDDDDDKNAYYNLPDHIRRSNLLFRAGEHWISLPLPQEYLAIYGMGELMSSVLGGKEHYTDGELAEKIMGQISQVLPIDIMEGGGGLGAFVPSSVKPLAEAYVMEKSWTGMPLYKNTPYNKDMPEWTKAYKSANKYIVGLAETMNEVTGGDPYTKGAVDINPAKVECMLNGYFGGVFSTIDKMVKTGETIFGDREYDPRSVLLANRLLKAGDERTEFRAINNEYFRLKEEHDQVKKRLKHYEDDTDNGVFDYAEKIDFLYNSPEFARYEIFEDYRRDIDDLYEELKEAANDEEYKEVEAELNALKKEMIHEMNETRNRK